MAKQSKQEEQPEQSPLQIVRTEDFEDLWANNVAFESTLWNLRVFFGQVDLAAHQITQHTAIDIPWPQVKIAAYFLLNNLLIHQRLNGNVFIPEGVMPARPNVNDPAAIPDKRMIEYMAWIHDQIFGPNPYVPPAVAAYDVATEQKTE